MVSPSISSPPKVPPLSYADRVKKAQNIRSPISLKPHRIVVQTAPSTSNASDTSSPSLISSSKSSPNSLSIRTTPTSATTTTVVSSVKPPLPPIASPTNNSPVEDENRTTNDLAAKALSIVAAHTAPQKSPVVNVWDLRKEQMAAARSPTLNNSSHIPISNSMSLASNSHPAAISSSKSYIHSAPNSTHGPSASTATNGVPAAQPPVEYDPFVVRIFTKRHRTQIPALPFSVDNAWPEVGKSTATSSSQPAASEKFPSVKEEFESSHGLGSEQVSASTSRKNEKTKWVPIPPEELQAAADASVKARKSQSHSRKGSQHIHSSNSNQSMQGSGSGFGSTQIQSRIQSATQSASHSRIQSRAASIHSSPSFQRESHLPAEDGSAIGAGVYTGPNHPHTDIPPQASSPKPHVLQPQPQPVIYTDTTAPRSEAYYPPILHQPSSYLRASPHPLPNGYHQGGTPPVYMTYSTPYPVYVPYVPQPYPYWDGHSHSHPGSGYQSPAYPPTSYMPGGVIPPNRLGQHAASRPRSESSPIGPVRPPPPELSQPVGSYRALSGVDMSINGVPNKVGHAVLFGSIGTTGASKSPSPAPLVEDGYQNTEAGNVEEKPFTAFSIGFGPGNASFSRLRSRTVSSKARSSAASESGLGPADAGEEPKFIDLTDPRDTKWEFGTATAVPEVTDVVAAAEIKPLSDLTDANSTVTQVGSGSVPHVLTPISGLGSPLLSTAVLRSSPHQSSEVLKQSPGSPSGLLQTIDSNPSPVQQLQAELLLNGESNGDEFEVKDYGYGFGPVSGTGFAETITRAERTQRQREQKVEQERERLEKEKMEQFNRMSGEHDAPTPDREPEREKFLRDTDVPIRPRRGGYHGSYNNDRGGHERLGSGYGGRRGRGSNGFGRGYRRGGGFQQQRHPPFNVTPPQSLFQPLMPMSDPASGFYPQHRPPLTVYQPQGYESYPTILPPLNTDARPPVPVPISPISFPLDPTRWYLLGQLEYYLSPQNMAQDFFLRQRMDSRGWIPISLIASFNRVRQLTADIQLVRDVLILSSVVQVKDQWVRMGGWEQFVLPDALPSTVEVAGHERRDGRSEQQPQSHPENTRYALDEANNRTNVTGTGEAEEDEVEVDGDADDDEDEDVVFVMSNDAAGPGPWSPSERQG